MVGWQALWALWWYGTMRRLSVRAVKSQCFMLVVCRWSWVWVQSVLSSTWATKLDWKAWKPEFDSVAVEYLLSSSKESATKSRSQCISVTHHLPSHSNQRSSLNLKHLLYRSNQHLVVVGLVPVTPVLSNSSCTHILFTVQCLSARHQCQCLHVADLTLPSVEDSLNQ